jgi:(S)-ureidoglycine aminohydrolase
MKIASILIIILFLPAVCISQLPAIASKRYSWITPTDSQANLMSSIIFEGAAHDMEFLQMSANAVASKESIAMQVPDNEEHLLLMKTGTIKIKIKDRIQSIGPGSIALLMPGENYEIQETGAGPGTFYLMKYRSKKPVNKTAATKEVSFIKDWNEVVFKPHDRGGIRNFFEETTPMSKRFEMHVTTLKEGIKSHEPHTHRAEEIVLIIENKTEMQIGDQFYKGGSGDIYYLGSNVPHAIQNIGTGTCTYFAFQFE